MTLELINYAVMAILVAAALLDARSSKIPNWLIYLLLAIFGVKAAVFPEAIDIYWQIGAAVIVFLVGLGAFAMGAFGAGAVKLSAAVMLFMPFASWLSLAAIMFGFAFAFTFIFMGVRAFFGSEDSNWACLRKRIVPLSWPIGATAFVGMFLL